MRSIKIGFSKQGIRQRIYQMQVGSPDKLVFLGACVGDKEYEKYLHKKYSDYRLSGEWFKPSKTLLDEIKSRCMTNLSEADFLAYLIETEAVDANSIKDLSPDELVMLNRQNQREAMKGVRFSAPDEVMTGRTVTDEEHTEYMINLCKMHSKTKTLNKWTLSNYGYSLDELLLRMENSLKELIN